MVDVYRAPMRSRSDDVDPAATLERAFALGVVGFGDIGRTPRQIARFAEVDDGSFAWTRDAAGFYRLGRIEGPYRHDDDGRHVDLVHVRPCTWSEPLPEHRVPAAVLATFARGGRNFQRTRDASVGAHTQALWDQSQQP